jgi:integrase
MVMSNSSNDQAIGDPTKGRQLISPVALEARALQSNLAQSVRKPYPEVITVADVLVCVREHRLLSENVIAKGEAAVRLLEKVLGRSAEQIPARPKQLNPLMRAATPARQNVRHKTWLNTTCSIRGLLRPCGLHAPIATEKRPSDPAWAAAIDTLPKEKGGAGAALPGFARWCSDSGILIEAVTEQTLNDYIEYRDTETIISHIVGLTSAVRTGWNRAIRAKFKGWPARLLQAPRHPGVEALPPEDFPPSLMAHISEYLTKRILPDAFDADHKPWKPTTAREARRFLIRAASLIAGRLGSTQHLLSLTDVITVENCEFVLRHIYERSDRIWRGHAGNFANCLLVVARDFVRVDQATICRLEQLRDIIVKRVGENRRPGLSERIDKQLMPFQDQKFLKRFFNLPAVIYRKVAKSLEDKPGVAPSINAKKRIIRAAQEYEKALMIDFLQCDPMRRGTLAAINTETDFEYDDRGRVTDLSIPGSRTKNGIAIDTPISSDLANRIAKYLSDHRPHLRGSDSPWLFPSPKGGHRSPDNVTKAIVRVIRQNLGVTCPPHLLRHIIATQLYRQNPANGVVVQRKLRHTSLKTTERMYGALSNASANGAWQTELEQFRRAKVSARASRAQRQSKLRTRGV